MQAQFDNFRLRPGKLPRNALLSREGNFTCDGEPARYRFYESECETYLTMYFRDLRQTVRVVNLHNESIEYLDDQQKEALGDEATSNFAEHIQNTGKLPDLTYPL